MVSAKFLLFVLGILTAVVGAIGLALSFNFVPAFLTAFPADSKIYFIITTLLGLIAIAASFCRRRMY